MTRRSATKIIQIAPTEEEDLDVRYRAIIATLRGHSWKGFSELDDALEYLQCLEDEAEPVGVWDHSDNSAYHHGGNRIMPGNKATGFCHVAEDWSKQLTY